MMEIRPNWQEYFLLMAKLASTRSTCLAFPVGAVIVKDNQIVATGYNGVPSGSVHCTSQDFCYPSVKNCALSSSPSRAVHAEANAIAQAAQNGIPTRGASIYVTLEPCLNCLKLIIAAGIDEVFYEKPQESRSKVSQMFIDEGLVAMEQISVRKAIAGEVSALIGMG